MWFSCVNQTCQGVYNLQQKLHSKHLLCVFHIRHRHVQEMSMMMACQDQQKWLGQLRSSPKPSQAPAFWESGPHRVWNPQTGHWQNRSVGSRRWGEGTEGCVHSHIPRDSISQTSPRIPPIFSYLCHYVIAQTDNTAIYIKMYAYNNSRGRRYTKYNVW